MTRHDRIEGIIKILEEQICTLKSIGLCKSASLLRIAWLDLRRRNDRISIRELQALCDNATRVADEGTNKRRAVSVRKTSGGKPSKIPKTANRRASSSKTKFSSARIINMQEWRPGTKRPT